MFLAMKINQTQNLLTNSILSPLFQYLIPDEIFSIPYIISGDPIPLARARYNTYSGKVYDSQKLLKHGYILQLQSQHNIAGLPQYTGPLHLDITFYLPMPKVSDRKRKEMENSYHFVRPDISNLLKMIEDVASNNILFHDDCLISSICVKKVYGSEPRTEFKIVSLK